MAINGTWWREVKARLGMPHRNGSVPTRNRSELYNRHRILITPGLQESLAPF